MRVQVTRFVLGWLLFFAYFGTLYFFEYSVIEYSVSLATGSAYAMPVRAVKRLGGAWR
jgi:hypothetical protein